MIRRSTLTSLMVFILVAQADSGVVSDHRWAAVLEDGRVETFSGAIPRETEFDGAIVKAWHWSSTTMPRPVALENLTDLPEHPEDREGEGWFSVQILEWGAHESERIELLAGPQEMWRDIPEKFIPSWPISSEGRVRIPTDGVTDWRLRAIGQGVGSWWLDIPAKQSSVAVSIHRASTRRMYLVDEMGRFLEKGAIYATSSRGEESFGSGHLAGYSLDGDANLIRSLPPTRQLKLVGVAPHRVPGVVVGRPDTLPERIELAKGGSLRGRFVNADREGISGVRVRLESWVSEEFPSYLRRSSESDAAGSWGMDGIPLGSAVILARAQGYAPVNRQVSIAGDEVDLGEVVLQSGMPLRLRVLDDLGSPVAEATVEGGGGGLVAVTGSSGEAVLNDVPPQAMLSLRFRASGHLPLSRKIMPSSSEEALEVRLRRAFELRGRFVDSDALPVANATARYELCSEYRTTPLDSSGEFVLSLAPGEEYRLVLRSSSVEPVSIVVPPGLPGESRDLGDITASQGKSLIGWIVDANTLEPVPGAHIWVIRPSARGILASWVEGDVAEALSDTEGSFLLSGIPEAAAPLTIRIDAAGYARRQLNVRPDVELSTTELGQIELVQGGEIVVVAEGEAADGAVARLDLGGRHFEPDIFSNHLVGGRASFRNVPAGDVTVSVEKEGLLLCRREIRITVADLPMNIVCEPQIVRVAGQVFVGEAPDGPGRLVWTQSRETASGFILNRSTPGGLRRQRALGFAARPIEMNVGAEGFFGPAEMRPGTWEVKWTPNGRSASPSTSVTIPAQDEFTAAVVFPGFLIGGEVVDREGRLIEGARVSELRSGAFAITGADGRYRLIGLSAGPGHLRARKQNLSSEIVDVEIAGDRSADFVPLVLEENPNKDRLRVEATGRMGTPLQRAFIFVETDTTPLRVVTTGILGAVEVKMGRPLPTKVRLALYGAGAVELGEWMPWDEAREAPIAISMQRTGGLLVNSEERSGTLRLVSANGWDVASLLSRVGLSPRVEAGVPQAFDGLPPMEYRVGVESLRETVQVKAGRRVRLTQ